MAQQNAEQAEDYDYEALPPNFSLAQNMAAGAFAGIAVSLLIAEELPGNYWSRDRSELLVSARVPFERCFTRGVLWKE